ncbi:hypothetical protein PC129_g20600 [Phytophthora cactorum]|uniref:Uncharacterized protein n=2 Tax=Phytophthora cactorum TaxID=29920 RepID=A0A329RDQ2_9STRA|nr:hypothetical protein Pcac1_g3471 [Phytophthora cactorum]KAG2801818.1 hypothetical protein PC112_g19883 [Phytophthora cactorum]KAG2807725.1 hypothetical protein PC111_g16810 [Phytophthora cactorum]KAG2880803.1 hypothetical protein PC114_g21880 [Phytophthora cactorum]KAG2889612.1 hypothetical protein PC115_g19696 [Phytophthora cactorum]
MRKFNVKRDMPGLQQGWFEYRVMEERGIVEWGPTETKIRYIIFVLLQDVLQVGGALETPSLQGSLQSVVPKLRREAPDVLLQSLSRMADVAASVTGCRIEEVGEIQRALGRPHFRV